MQCNYLSSLLVVFLLPAVAHCQQAEWRRNFEDLAKVDALAEGKLILLYFESTSDEQCIEMDSETWNQPAVVKMLKRFVCVKIDFEQMRLSSNLIRKDRNQNLAVRYRVATFRQPSSFTSPEMRSAGRRPCPGSRDDGGYGSSSNRPLQRVFPPRRIGKSTRQRMYEDRRCDNFQQLKLYEASNIYYRESVHAEQSGAIGNFQSMSICRWQGTTLRLMKSMLPSTCWNACWTSIPGARSTRNSSFCSQD